MEARPQHLHPVVMYPEEPSQEGETYPLKAVDDVTVDKADNSGNTTPDTPVKEREKWSSQLEFLLSLLGYAVGLGNLWRFPYLCMRNGGGAFLIPFLFCLVTCGLPLFYLEVSLGQFLGKGALHCWCICPLFRGIGIGMTILLTVISLYYNIIIAWTLFYLGNSFLPQLPWYTCDSWWNTERCIVQSSANLTNQNTTLSDVTNSSGAPRTSAEEFWQFNVLQMSSGLHELGTVPWYLAVSFIGAWLFVFLCIMKGVKSIGKVVYVTALLPYILFTILLIKGATLPGAADGIVYYLKPNVERMMRMQVWVEAALQVCYSLGFCWGPIITMASYNRFNNNTFRDALFITFAGEGTSLFSGLVVFTVLGFVAKDLGVPVEEVVQSGPGLGFIAYPQALARLPVPQLWSCLFFFMLFMVGLDSQFATCEAVFGAIIDTFPKLNKRRVLVTAAFCIIGFLVGLPMTTQGGIYIFQLVDWYVASLAIPCFGVIECFIFGWIYGAERFSRDVEMMRGHGINIIVRICVCVLTPVVLLTCFISTLRTYTPPTYGQYEYPPVAQAFGWLLASLPLIPIPLAAGYQIYSQEGPFSQRLLRSLRPSRDYKPNSKEHQNNYSYMNSPYEGITLWQRIKLNLLGSI